MLGGKCSCGVVRYRVPLTHGADRLLVVGDEDLNDNFDQVQVMTQLGLMPAAVTT